MRPPVPTRFLLLAQLQERLAWLQEQLLPRQLAQLPVLERLPVWRLPAWRLAWQQLV